MALCDVIVVVNNEFPLEDSSVLRRAEFDAKSSLIVVILELLSDNDAVRELTSVSIVIMLWFNEPMFEVDVNRGSKLRRVRLEGVDIARIAVNFYLSRARCICMRANKCHLGL